MYLFINVFGVFNLLDQKRFSVLLQHVLQKLHLSFKIRHIFPDINDYTVYTVYYVFNILFFFPVVGKTSSYSSVAR